MYYVYILKSTKINRTYVGYSNDWERRLTEHNSGQSRATKNRGPFEIFLIEKFETAAEAKRKELWWKSGAGRRKLKSLLANIA